LQSDLDHWHWAVFTLAFTLNSGFILGSMTTDSFAEVEFGLSNTASVTRLKIQVQYFGWGEVLEKISVTEE